LPLAISGHQRVKFLNFTVYTTAIHDEWIKKFLNTAILIRIILVKQFFLNFFFECVFILVCVTKWESKLFNGEEREELECVVDQENLVWV